ncbi:TEAD4 [Cordylochernes scorpioides]|uniref:TEAD4 n=1 Tax=Cordylochernes scorpioides TaxID=51811 RepID=A0ABY6KSP8_9ARAC|nr:TEAD4 [Cordylochernes scorpioides]
MLLGSKVRPLPGLTISSPWHAAADGAGSPDLADDDSKGDVSSDAEGVWSPDIEQSFQEALAIYPPCGRRKIILSDEGKMYELTTVVCAGRNELIARYIKVRTGKTRTRKQVSSHIQVLARRKAREIQTKLKVRIPLDQPSKDVALQSMSSMSSAQIVSLFCSQDQGSKDKAFQSLTSSPAPKTSLATPPSFNSPATFWPPGLTQPGPSEDIKPFSSQTYTAAMLGKTPDLLTPPPSLLPFESRSIASSKLRLIEFTAFMECRAEAVDIKQIYDKFPEKKGGLKDLFDKGPQNAFFLVKFWADLSCDLVVSDVGALYAVTSQFESNENMVISCSTKVCSFGKQVVEKVETEQARFENNHFVYKINRSPMCEYMVNFISKLKHLPEKYMMNSVLENFTILQFQHGGMWQVVTNRDTQETLLCFALVFEVSSNENGAQHHIYRLVKE